VKTLATRTKGPGSHEPEKKGERKKLMKAGKFKKRGKTNRRVGGKHRLPKRKKRVAQGGTPGGGCKDHPRNTVGELVGKETDYKRGKG